MFNRRDLVVGGSLTIFWGSTCRCLAQAGHDPAFGCTLTDAEADEFLDSSPDTRLYITGNEPMIPKSGDKDFDLALAHTLAKLSDRFEVAPGFAYYDDYDGHNAYATSRARLNGADGTVLFGQGLLRRLMSLPEHPEVAVAAVCAHEFGHILQYKTGLADVVGAGQPTVKRVELQADFLAGYFAGTRKRELNTFPAAVFAMTQESFGDNMVDHPGHHGTPDERAAAIVRGFEEAYQNNRSLAEAKSISTSYVQTL